MTTYRDDSKKMGNLFYFGGGVGGAAHNPTWTDNQNSLNTLFTSEEHRMVLDEAREEADGFTGKPLAIWYRLQQASWYQQRILIGMGMLGYKLSTTDIAFLSGL